CGIDDVKSSDGHDRYKKNRRERALADFKNKDQSIFKSPDSAPFQFPGMTVGKMFSYHPTLLIPDSARFRQRPLSFEFIESGCSRSKYSWRVAPLSHPSNEGIINRALTKTLALIFGCESSISVPAQFPA